MAVDLEYIRVKGESQNIPEFGDWLVLNRPSVRGGGVAENRDFPIGWIAFRSGVCATPKWFATFTEAAEYQFRRTP